MTSPFIEAMARAIDPEAWRWAEEGGTGRGAYWTQRRNTSRDKAQAALKAISESEPTEAMLAAGVMALIDAGLDGPLGVGHSDAAAAFSAMLSALPDTGGE